MTDIETTELPTEEAVSETETTTAGEPSEVTKLKDEAAKRRIEASEATQRGDALYELLLQRTKESATADLLQNVDDLPANGDYFDENGFPDAERIRAAADALIMAKPYLGKVRGNINQGPKQSESVSSFGDILRGAL